MRPSITHGRRGRTLALAGATLLLAGCASFTPDGGFDGVRQATQPHLSQDLRWARSEADRQAIDRRVAELLQQPLGADAAVQLALLNNRGLQAAFFELGIAEADLVQAGRLPNPGFSFGRSARGDEREIAGDGGGRSGCRTGAPHAARRQLQRSGAGARAGLLRRRRAQPRPRAAGPPRRASG
jgi:outer membrane protein TolC